VVTLIARYASEGCVGRCDAKCYNAEEDECDCICGGANHGAGIQTAMDNTRAYAESWVEKARAAGQDVSHIEMAMDAQCEPLFGFREVTG